MKRQRNAYTHFRAFQYVIGSNRFATDYFGFESLLPMNTGAEGVETATKITRKWGHTVGGIPEEQAQIVVCDNNFHGRTTTIISFPLIRDQSYFGPHIRFHPHSL